MLRQVGVNVFETIAFVSTLMFALIGVSLFVMNRRAMHDDERDSEHQGKE